MQERGGYIDRDREHVKMAWKWLGRKRAQITELPSNNTCLGVSTLPIYLVPSCPFSSITDSTRTHAYLCKSMSSSGSKGPPHVLHNFSPLGATLLGQFLAHAISCLQRFFQHKNSAPTDRRTETGRDPRPRAHFKRRLLQLCTGHFNTDGNIRQ